MTLKTIRNGIHKIDKYLNAALDLFGGDDGLCHYKCSDGKVAPCLFCEKLIERERVSYETGHRQCMLIYWHSRLLIVFTPVL